MTATLLITIFAAVTFASPIPNNPINLTIANIESFFENSLGSLAGSLISHHHGNGSESFQSQDGSLHANIQPITLGSLAGITFKPSNHALIAENETVLFHNSTEEVDVAKIDLGSSINGTNSSTESPMKAEVLKAIPTSIVAGATTTTATPEVTTGSPKSTESTLGTSSTAATTQGISSTSPSANVVFVTPVNTTTPKSVTSSTEKINSSEAKDVEDKIKEVEADPVILTSGV
ncbi:uncharacterized protein LOC129749815 [Uranotaenia lowii]|uniref:uncharacterized protein LOC129749815 n=1 Tax=Uranotaenia lowii TaxID=190385 RepID=UPI00247966CC|nr:uncharacterized protein LOC129749815 [Uranotaenia lowii]